MSTPARQPAGPATLILGWLLLTAGPVGAQPNNALPEEGAFVTVATPITSEVVQRVRNQIEPRRNSVNRPIRKVVFDFTPDGKDAYSTDFGPCSTLANFISSLPQVQTVAFVHGKAVGHTVLPILACKELVMSKGASLGEVTDGGEELRPWMRDAYREIIARPTHAAVVEKMFDKDLRLARGKSRKNEVVWYFDLRKEEEAKRQHELAGVQDLSQYAAPGKVALFTAEQAVSLGLCKAATVETRADAAERYGLPAVDDDPLQGRTPDAYRYTLTGEVDGAMRESVNRIIRDVKRKKGNVLILTLDCGANGDLGIARALADDLREAQSSEGPILIVGFIPDRAAGAATFVAFGCSQIVMSKRRDAEADKGDEHEARLGDFKDLVAAGPAVADPYRKSLKDLVEKRGSPGILVDGMFDRDLEIVWVKEKTGATRRRLMSRAEFDAEKAGWVEEKQIKPRGQLLVLTATLAEELGVARYAVDARDPAAVYQEYGLEAAKVKEVSPGWLDKFAEFLRRDVVTVLLVVIGFTGLILELKVPGLTVPGIVSALCFILVFWSQSRFSGEMFVLALLLFILGLALVGLEIFVLPGFGAPGIFGILCMLAGLGLVTFERVPQTTGEWGMLGLRVTEYLFGMIGAFVMAFGIARYLPKVPYANRMMLGPPVDGLAGAELLLPGAGEAAGMMGAIGTANTSLRPAGVVRIGDKFVDVVSDGGFIAAGTRVQVVAVEGTRIVVKEV